VNAYLRDERVHLIQESRQGLLFARNAGLAAATGEVLAQLDADCLPDTHWLSNAAPYFANPAIVGVTGPYDYYDGSWYFRFVALMSQKLLYRFFSWYLQKKKRGALLIGGNAFIRKTALQKAGGYNTALQFYAEDTDTAKRIVPFGKIIFDIALVMKTSHRRFATQGFFTTSMNYYKAFFSLAIGRDYSNEQSAETVHPR
jgi:cellulose synthase/poly-beta-1,6-N-acetylglucosamine synthase-like glycosyltransferase